MLVDVLYRDPATGQILQTKPTDQLNLSVHSEVKEYVTLFQNSVVGTCCSIVDQTAIPINSKDVLDLPTRDLPYVDCVILEEGLAGQRVLAAVMHGKVYPLTISVVSATDNLYLGQDSLFTTTKPSKANGDKYQVCIGRLVNQNEFIFDPQIPIDFDVPNPGGGGTTNFPDQTGHANEFLQTDGNNVRWAPVRAGNVQPDFAITGFGCSVNVLELGQAAINPILSGSYNSALSSARYKDSVNNNWISIASPYNSWVSPYTFRQNIQSGVSFTLEAHASDGTIKTASTSISWYPRKYYGSSSDNPNHATLVLSLSNSQLSGGKTGSFTVNCLDGQYIFFAIPSSFGVPTFFVGGFEGGFFKVDGNIQVTNAYGITISYDLYRSDNHSLGNTTVSVT